MSITVSPGVRPGESCTKVVHHCMYGCKASYLTTDFNPNPTPTEAARICADRDAGAPDADRPDSDP